ncbi:hypothetical protein PDESU_04610 [Pontiella desulfatans]|uniref:START domain-containing protein n=1 Tax=Pontiella desulfatans TaxID=2750659 RepID=A0A6C2U7J7_PONDE|nr:START domain-containing protein [Pontiella desulfatans]VGO16020.1 hypothetical protein PDESU_04610 [Pontiella desulfatans]
MIKLPIIILLLSTVTALAGDWKLAKDEDGIKVYTRGVEGTGFKQFKGVARIPARLSTLIAVFNDLDSAAKWVKTCDRIELIEQVSPAETYTYAYNPAPWPVKDRDAVLHNVIMQNPTNYIVTITQTAAPDKIPRLTKAIRVERIESLWTLTPQNDGSVEVVYQSLSDPGGRVPATLVNAVSVSQPYTSLKGIWITAQEKRFKNVKLGFIREPGDS